MKTGMEMIAEWDAAMDEPKEYFPPAALVRLRMRLLDEEHKEVRKDLIRFLADPCEAVREGARSALAKELCDLLYITYGTASVLDIDLDRAFAEVHASNMSKMGEDGKAIRRDDGKVLKGPNYREPDLSWLDPIEGSVELAE